MGRKYIQGRKLFWASLALILILVVLPASLGLAYWWNENVAGSDAIAYELNNKTLTSGQIYTGSAVVSFDFYYTNTTGITHTDLAPFWNANGSWDEVIYPAYTKNNSYQEMTAISWNLSAQQIMDMNINKIEIKMEGLDTSINQTQVKITAHTPIISDNSNGVYTIYNNNAVKINNGTIDLSVEIEPAVASLINNYYGNKSILTIQILDYDSTHSPFVSGGIVDFQIYATHPHGNMVIGSYDFMTTVIWLFTVGGIFVLFVTSPAWNPTTHNGLIDHLINRAKYAHRKKSHTSHSRHRSHRSHSSHRRRTTHHRRRR